MAPIFRVETEHALDVHTVPATEGLLTDLRPELALTERRSAAAELIRGCRLPDTPNSPTGKNPGTWPSIAESNVLPLRPSPPM